MVSEVLPDVPWVQMVFTIPKMLRPLFLWDRTLYGVFHPAPENLDFTPPLENLFREKLFKVLLRREKITEERVELLRLASWLCSRVPRFSRSPGGCDAAPGASRAPWSPCPGLFQAPLLARPVAKRPTWSIIRLPLAQLAIQRPGWRRRCTRRFNGSSGFSCQAFRFEPKMLSR